MKWSEILDKIAALDGVGGFSKNETELPDGVILLPQADGSMRARIEILVDGAWPLVSEKSLGDLAEDIRTLVRGASAADAVSLIDVRFVDVVEP
ncbi:MAG: hypothetical protein Q3962_07225 [Corynebacterium sp.]|nr:hypothetical protein [Corynebacterium sp.]